ncbi:pentapeptide repeat-containing protein [Trichocoleus sp. FACHB-591]|uniref:pentapeptide repeat-containing protein n=1 Tax=Trichocoleus sp. FACHB-591 TaxID=2692872 RepID=UPI00168A3561|nr:pentapeptide repeat-containing protein [Trichocoleus sp. FACHB-591]MBD2095908.1 pentapeptide repeat-containing protein [Trichocoleus sp. FACHB-591]
MWKLEWTNESPDPYHVSLIQQGANTWNNWRRQNPEIIPNFHKASLSNFNLTGMALGRAEFKEATLEGANLRSAYLQRAIFSKANLKGADLSGADLSDVDFGEADLSGADLSRARLGGAILTKAKLVGTKFIGAILDEVKLYEADLSEATLCRATARKSNFNQANLSGADLSQALLPSNEFNGANLSKANLSDAVLSSSNLSKANLSEASLERANLTIALALGTNFNKAKFTGACLKDWHINRHTQLEEIICDYVYFHDSQQDRRPYSRNFAPGEFTELLRKSQETLELIFLNGIEWSAFLTSLRNLQVESEGNEPSVEAIEKKNNDAFVVRVKVLPNADKEIIEKRFYDEYAIALKSIDEKYQYQLKAQNEQIQFYREKSADLTEIVKLLASRPINIEATAIAESNSMSEASKYDQRGAQIGNFADTVQDNARLQAIQHNHASEQKHDSVEVRDMVNMLSELEQIIHAAKLPASTEEEATAYLKVAKKETEKEMPNKDRLKSNLEGLAEVLEKSSKTVDAGKNLYEKAVPVFAKIAPWLGVAVSHFFG